IPFYLSVRALTSLKDFEKRPSQSVNLGRSPMRILLYNPDNGITRNFMPHLWMFLLKTLTPAEHEVLLIDGNARPMDEQQLVHFIRKEKIDFVGIVAMTRMIARRYRIADAIRAPGVRLV